METNRDELLNSGYDWRASDVKPQLRSLPEKFELNTYIEKMMGCLEKVQLAFVCIGLPDVKRVSDYIRNLTEPLNGRYGKPCVYILEGTPENPVVGEVHGNVKTPISWIPVELAEYITNLPEPEALSQYEGFALNIRSPNQRRAGVNMPRGPARAPLRISSDRNEEPRGVIDEAQRTRAAT